MTSNEFLLFVSEWLGVIAVMWVIGLIPSFQFRPVRFMYPKREGVISISLYVVMLAAAFMFTSGRDTFGLTPPESVPMELWIRLILGGIGLLAFGLSLLVRRQPLLSIAWNMKRWTPVSRLALALAVGSIFLRGKAATITNGFSGVEISMLLVWLGIALAEETIFRGFIQLRLSTLLGDRYGWFVTALLYVLWSVPFALMTPDITLIRIVFAAGQGLVLGFLVRRAGHIFPIFIYRAISEWLVFAS